MAEQSKGPAEIVQPATAPYGGKYSERQAQKDRKSESARRELDSGRHPFQYDVQDGSAFPQRLAKVAGSRASQPKEILYDYRLVEAPLAAPFVPLLLGRVFVQENGARIT